MTTIFAAVSVRKSPKFAALRMSVRKWTIAQTAFFGVLLALVAAKLESSNRHLAAVFLLAAILCCLTGAFTLRILKRP